MDKKSRQIPIKNQQKTRYSMHVVFGGALKRKKSSLLQIMVTGASAVVITPSMK